jgi:hypothetical protein
VMNVLRTVVIIMILRKLTNFCLSFLKSMYISIGRLKSSKVYLIIFIISAGTRFFFSVFIC